jgi:uncharacterized RmlC-like cupin family protein
MNTPRRHANDQFTVHESEIEGTRKDPPRISKILISEHTIGAKQISMGVNVTEVNSRIPLHKHTESEEAMFVIQGRGFSGLKERSMNSKRERPSSLRSE